MNTIIYILIILMGLGLLFWAAMWALRRGPNRQIHFFESLLQAQETTLTEGTVLLEGTAQLKMSLSAPLSGDEALAWELRIGTSMEVGDGPSKSYVAVTPVISMASFSIYLGNTEILVSGKPHHIITISWKTYSENTQLISALPIKDQKLAINEIKSGKYKYDIQLNKPLIMKEYIIRPGAEVVVIGNLQWSSDQKQWQMSPCPHRPMVLIEGTRQQFLDDLRTFRRSLSIEYPLN